MLRVSACLWLLLSLCASGCNDLQEFHGSFDGSIVKGNFVRSCFPGNTEASMYFSPDWAVGDHPEAGANPNWFTTTDGTFQHTPLEPVQKLEGDQLSQFDFPGQKRLANYILLARPTSGPLAGRDAFVVVSLLENKRLEVRVIARTLDGGQACSNGEERSDAGTNDAGTQSDAGASGDQPATGPREYFGLFRLHR